MKKYLWLIGTAAVLLAILGIGTLVHFGLEPSPPDGVRCFKNTKLINVRSADETEWDNGYQVKHLAVKLKSGEFVTPTLHIMRPNFRGIMGSVRQDPVWECQVYYLGERKAMLHFPVDGSIELYILGLRRLEGIGKPGDDPWHVWEVTRDDVERDGAGALIVPRVGGLKLLDARDDAKVLIGRFEVGERFAYKLRE